jgi:hypothetical protein
MYDCRCRNFRRTNSVVPTQPMSPLPVSKPIAGDCYIGESSKGVSWGCPSCGRGCMHRAHRASYLDFFVSIFGIYPTACCRCRARGRRLYPERLLIRLCAAILAIGFLVLCNMQRAKPFVWDSELPSKAVNVKSANSPSLPSPPSKRYTSPIGPGGDVSLNPEAPPPIK